MGKKHRKNRWTELHTSVRLHVIWVKDQGVVVVVVGGVKEGRQDHEPLLFSFLPFLLLCLSVCCNAGFGEGASWLSPAVTYMTER